MCSYSTYLKTIVQAISCAKSTYFAKENTFFAIWLWFAIYFFHLHAHCSRIKWTVQVDNQCVLSICSVTCVSTSVHSYNNQICVQIFDMIWGLLLPIICVYSKAFDSLIGTSTKQDQDERNSSFVDGNARLYNPHCPDICLYSLRCT